MTYAEFDFASVPALPTVTADFSWLAATAQPQEVSIGGSPTLSDDLLKVIQEPIPVPDQFARFIDTPELNRSVRSSTGCWLDLAGFRLDESDWLVLFLRDQQDCLQWFLHVDKDGGSRVLVGRIAPEKWYDADEPAVSDWTGPIDGFVVCAATFEQFVYRFWIENEIWFRLQSLDTEPALTPEQLAYVQQYE